MNERSHTDLKALGEGLGRLRVKRKWSRPELLSKLNQELFAVGYTDKVLGEKWLHRLENGQLVVLPRIIFNAIVRVLECSDEESAHLHLLGDRNVAIITPGVTTRFTERFNYLMSDFLIDVCAIVENQAENQLLFRLSQEDIDELFFTAIEMVIAERRSGNRSK